MKKYVYLTVTFHIAYLSRKGDLSKVEVEAEKSRLSLHKRIAQCEEYDKCVAIATSVRKDIREKWGFPTVVLRDGVYIIPIELVEEVKEYIEEKKAEFNSWRDRFIKKYTRLIEEDRVRLGILFSESDYPSPEEMARKFYVYYRFFEINDLPIGLEERQKELEEEYKQLQYFLRKGMLEIFQTVLNCLGTTPSGRKGGIKEKTFERLCFLLDVFGKRNITEDKELADIVDKMKAIFEGKSLADVQDHGFHGRIQEEVANLVRKTKRLVEESERCITLD